MASWVIRFANGRVKGPYPTETILQMIEKGQLQGDEFVSRMPGGQWRELSAEPVFYDQILKTLEQAQRPVSEKERRQREETVIAPPPKENDLLWQKIESANSDAEASKSVESAVKHAAVAPSIEGAQSGVIEMKSVPKFEKEESLKKYLFPAVLALVLIFGAYLFLSESGSSDESKEKITLLAPRPSQGAISPEELKQKLNEALLGIEGDTFQGYFRAQSLLVSIVENSRELTRQQQLESRALLCTVYKFLWPHSKQSVQDIATIKLVRDGTRALEVTSPYADVCELVSVSTQASFREMRSTLDAVFAKNLAGFNMVPVLYQMKGELLALDKDYINAVGFLNSATELWPKWIRPKVDLAFVYIKGRKSEDLGKAATLLKSVIDANPEHKAARYILGTLEYEEYRNNENAFSQLSVATGLSDRAPVLIESRALQIYSELLLARNQKSEALKFARQALSINPNNAELKQLVLRLGGDDKSTGRNNHMQMLYMGESFERQGDCLAAQAEYKAAYEADNRNGIAAMKAGRCLWELNQSYEAIDWLKKAIKAEPKLVSAYALLSEYLSEQYDFLGATQILATANRENPGNYEVMRGFASLEYKKGNLRAAIDYAKRSLAIYDGDIENLIVLSRASSDLVSTSIAVSKSDQEKRQALAEEALRFATKAIELNPTHVKAQINYANVMSSVHGGSAGVRYLEEKTKAFSYEMEYRVGLGELLMREERFSEALQIFENVTAIDKKSKKAWLGLGVSYRARGNNNQALRAFLEAAVLDPTDATALFEAGRVYYETQRFQEAIEQFKRVNAINPNFPRAHYYIGRAALAAGNSEQALQEAKIEQKLNPQIADPYILMAEAYRLRRQFTDCANSYSQAVKYRPQGAEIYVRAAECYRQAGSVEVAEDMLTLALERESGLADIYREQAVIFEIKGDFRGAVRSYNIYLGLSPNAPDRRAIEVKLRALGGQ